MADERALSVPLNERGGSFALPEPGQLRSGDQEISHDQVPPLCFDIACPAHYPPPLSKSSSKEQNPGSSLGEVCRSPGPCATAGRLIAA